jgi:hypothetical protein
MNAHGFMVAISMKQSLKRKGHVGAGYDHRAVFERLPRHLQNVPREFRQFVQERQPVCPFGTLRPEAISVARRAEAEIKRDIDARIADCFPPKAAGSYGCAGSDRRA